MQHYSTNVTWLRRLAAGVTVAGMDTGCGATPVVWRGGAEPVQWYGESGRSLLTSRIWNTVHN